MRLRALFVFLEGPRAVPYSPSPPFPARPVGFPPSPGGRAGHSNAPSHESPPDVHTKVWWFPYVIPRRVRFSDLAHLPRMRGAHLPWVPWQGEG
jgi:hypothetical protein